MIPSEEVTDRAEGVPVHINASNVRDAIEPLRGKTVRETIEGNLRNIEEQAKKAGREMLAHLNHPNFGWAVTAEDIAHAVGKVLAQVSGLSPEYRLQGSELYVRAVVTSSAAAVDPSFPEQKKQAWTQPVGWE